MSDNKNPGSDVLRIDEAASLLGVNRRTVYRWVWKGELPATKIGGLYFIHRSELEKRLGECLAEVEEPTPAPELTLKCAGCSRLLTSKSQIGGVCAHEGCEQILCTQCISRGERYCSLHQRSKDERIQQAEQAYLQGETRTFLKSSTARLREINFINRLRERIAHIQSLIDPISGEVVNIQDWNALLETRDQRAEVMRLLGKVFLNGDALASLPQNASLHYRLPAMASGRGEMEIEIHALSDLKSAVTQGYQSQPLGEEVLLAQLNRLGENTRQDSAFCIAVLAATPGWDAGARRVIQGDRPLVIPRTLVYLYDLESGELLYNHADERTRRYAEMFVPILPEEEAAEAAKALQEKLVIHDSITLAEAVEQLPYPKTVIERAFERLAETGKYALHESPDFGKGIIKI